MGVLDLLGLRQAVADLAEQRAALRADIEALQAEREAIATAPPHRSDMKAAVRAWVGSQRARYERAMQRRLATMAAKPLRLEDPEHVARITFLGGAAGPEEEVTVAAMDQAIAFAFGAALEKELGLVIDRMPLEREGLPLAQRRQALAELDQRIEAALAAERELRETAQAAGIVLAD